jgi:deoxyribodipyrimidine photo-lyase
MIPETRLEIHGETLEPGICIVYWMIASRRAYYNHSLDHAIELANERNLPLVVVEPLAINHRWANDRIHTFVIQGMLSNKKSFEDSNVTYIPYVETKPKEAKGLLSKWMESADVLVIDDYPSYYSRKVKETAIKMAKCEVHVVDSNGFMATNHTDKKFTTAYSLRRHLHKTITQHMGEFPSAKPLEKAAKLEKIEYSVVKDIFAESNTPITPYEFLWRVCEPHSIGENALSVLSIDHSVHPIKHVKGGTSEASKKWNDFLNNRLETYGENRNQPELNGSSGLSPYLHFGHISAHQILREIFEKFDWDIMQITPPNDGRRSGWWGLPRDVESFLDQIVTWRDLGFIHCAQDENHHSYDSLPEWAKKTLSEHENDERPYLYTFEQLENCETHDDLWNAAQCQLKNDGIIHNYLRMLWGKKILEWTPNARVAMDYMVALNDKWALDGRDPNTYTGIGWVLGKFDRGWTERPVYGKIRYMTSDSTKRKFRTKKYVETYSNPRSKQSTLFQNPALSSVNITYEKR